MTSFKSIAFFLLVSTQLLFGAKDEAASTSSVEVYNDGAKQLVCYTDVPDLAPSDKYAIRVKSAATGNVWVPVFTHKTYNRQQELSEGLPNAVPPVPGLGWTALPKTDGTNNGTGIQNYLFFTGGWSHSYGNIEMSPGMPVQVEISAVNGFQIRGQNFFKAAVYPPQKAVLDEVADGKVIFTITNPAQIVIDINGNMDDSNKALVNINDRYDVRHTVSLFANPIMEKPSLRDTANVVAVEPGTIPSDDLGTKTTLYFKPGKHELGLNFKVKPGKNYYIPGDAIVYGTFNNVGVPGVGGRPSGENIKLYGYGTLSSQYTTHPAYVIGSELLGDDAYKSFVVDNAYNSEIHGICIADPANHASTQRTWTGRPDNGVPATFARWAKVISWRGNGDGLGTVALEEDCFFRTNDDSGYIKGSKYRCTYWKDTAAAVFHMAGIPDAAAASFPLVIEDCDLIYNRSRDQAGFAVFDQRGSGVPGLVNINLTVRNFRIHDKWANRRVFGLNSGNVGTSYSGIKFENISMPPFPGIIAGDSRMKGVIYGREEAPWFGGLMFKNVKFGNVTLTKENFATYFNTNEFANYFLFDDPRPLTLTTVADAAQGSVSRNLNQATYLEMSPVKLTAVANIGWVFSHWSGGASGSDNPLTVWMTDNKTITANFAVNIVDSAVVNTPGSGNWIVPAGVSSMTFQAWGGGGAGGSVYNGNSTSHTRGGGGAGGSYAGKTLLVQPGDVISYSVGAGGAGAPEGFTHKTRGESGGVSSFQINGTTVVSAVGGTGGENLLVNTSSPINVSGLGGNATLTGNTGGTIFYGGNGISADPLGSGSGGGSAGAAGNGGHALSRTAGGAAGADGGAVGGNGTNAVLSAGRPGGTPGAGGSGAIVRNSPFSLRTGGQGGDGKIIFNFNTIRDATYEEWLTFGAPAAGFDTDTDSDGISNGVECVLGSNPNTYSSGITLTSSTAGTVTYQHPLNPNIASNVSYSYEWSTDLIEWKASGQTNTGGTTMTITAAPPASGMVTVTLNGAANKRFIRLKAALN